MVDFRATGYSSTRSYSRSGSSRRGSSRSSSRKKKSRGQKRAEAFARPGLGQWTPGALTNAPLNTSRSVASRVGGSGYYPFVTRNGKSGQLVPAGQVMPTQQPVELGMSEAFKAKYNQAIQKTSKGNTKNAVNAEPLSFSVFENKTNPFQPNFTGVAPNAFADFQNTQIMQDVGNQNQSFWQRAWEKLKTDLDPRAPVTNDPSREIAGLIAGGPLLSTMTSALSTNQLASMVSDSATSKLLRVGVNGVPQDAKGIAGRIAVNAATQKATASWLSKLVKYATNPAVIVSGIMAAIGSYPFAGFIKEEALQATGFATRTAIENGDLVKAEEAIGLQREMLAPDVWRGIIDKVPYANVVASLKDYYKTANLQASVYEQIIEDKKIQLVTGETDNDRWVRVNDREANEYKANVDYFNEQRRLALLFEIEAKNAANEKQAQYWLEMKKKLMALEAEERERIADFWFEYKKKILELELSMKQKSFDESRHSQLGFGLLG